MTLDEFSDRWHEIRKKYDVLILLELMKLYDERYKNRKKKVPVEYIYNELHEEPIYSPEERDFIISEAIRIKDEQSNE